MFAPAALAIGRTFGIGGASWRYYATNAGGPSANTAVYLRGTRTLYIVRINPVKLGLAAPGQTVGVSPFVLVAVADTDIATGGYVQSESDETMVFSLGPLTTDQGFVTGLVEQTTLPANIHPAGLRAIRTGLQIGLR